MTDELDDIFLEPALAPARAGGRFRPKAKTRPCNVASTTVASAPPIDTKERRVTLSTTVSDTAASIKFVDVEDSKLTDPVSSSLATSDVPLSTATAAHQPEVAASDGNGNCKSSFGKAAGENADIFSELECLDGFISQTTRDTAESAASKAHDKADAGIQPDDKEGTVPISETETCLVVNFGAPTHCSTESSVFMVCDVAEAQTYSDYCTTQNPVSIIEVPVSNKQGDMQLETKGDGAFSDLEVIDVVSDATISSEQHAGKFQSKLKVKKGNENLHIPRSEVKSTTLSQAAHLVPSETGDMSESSHPAFSPEDVHDHPSPRFGDSSIPNPTSDSQGNTEATHSDAAIFGDAIYSEDVGGTPGKEGRKSRNGKASTASNPTQKRKPFASSEEAEGETSSRKLRKRLPRQQVDELVHEVNEDSFIAEPSNASTFNEDENNDNEYMEHKTSQRKRAPRNSNKPASEKEEPVRKRKRAKEAPDQSTKDPPKKFSHSTRRNKRHVDKSLLEIPEDEIDPQKLSLKNLIRLAEHRELLAIKEARKLATPVPDESANNDSHKEASHHEEDTFHHEDETFPSEHDISYEENQASYRVNASSSFLNYQTYMDKAPTVRWSKQDTELFYEAIQQCGSDFTMIQELYFPGRTRHQVKLKFKKEERQHPSRINEAILSRSTSSVDHSKFTAYIEKLQQVAQAAKESNAAESVDMPGEEIELSHDTDEGVTKPKSEELQDQEADVAEVEEAVAAEVNDPLKSDEIDYENFSWSED